MKDNWDKVKIVSGLIASILIPIVIAWIGYKSNETLKYQDVSLKYTELSIGILQSEEYVDSPKLRTWAVKVIDKYSGVSLGESGSEELIEKGLPTNYDYEGLVFLAKQLEITDTQQLIEMLEMLEMLKTLEDVSYIQGIDDLTGMEQLVKELNLKD